MPLKSGLVVAEMREGLKTTKHAIAAMKERRRYVIIMDAEIFFRKDRAHSHHWIRWVWLADHYPSISTIAKRASNALRVWTGCPVAKPWNLKNRRTNALLTGEI